MPRLTAFLLLCCPAARSPVLSGCRASVLLSAHLVQLVFFSASEFCSQSFSQSPVCVSSALQAMFVVPRKSIRNAFEEWGKSFILFLVFPLIYIISISGPIHTYCILFRWGGLEPFTTPEAHCATYLCRDLMIFSVLFHSK